MAKSSPKLSRTSKSPSKPPKTASVSENVRVLALALAGVGGIIISGFVAPVLPEDVVVLFD